MSIRVKKKDLTQYLAGPEWYCSTVNYLQKINVNLREYKDQKLHQQALGNGRKRYKRRRT